MPRGVGSIARTGIDPADAHRHKRETGSLNGLAGCQAVTNEELLTVTLRHPDPRGSRESAQGRQRARRPGADDRGVGQRPDHIRGRRGPPRTRDLGAAQHPRQRRRRDHSYYEWVQNNENEQWDEDEVNGKLERIMTKAADDVIEKQTKINGSLVDLETER